LVDLFALYDNERLTNFKLPFTTISVTHFMHLAAKSFHIVK